MKTYFYSLSDYAKTLINKDEFLCLNYGGENSEFYRLNNNNVRQGGNVFQAFIDIKLIRGDKKASYTFTLSKNEPKDKELIKNIISKLRDTLDMVPADPYILYSKEVNSTEKIGESQIPETQDSLEEIIKKGKGKDFVGIYASGNIDRGFANSIGQKNWYSTSNFNLSFSLYHRADKAVKGQYAGFEWNSNDFNRIMDNSLRDLEHVKKEAITIQRGAYRAYIAPSALSEFIGMLSWGGFSEKETRTKDTPLIKMIESNLTFNKEVSIIENNLEGISENFQSDGFIKKEKVNLIKNGNFGEMLISPRTAKEYNLNHNGANLYEMPESIDIPNGNLDEKDILKKLDTGVLINNTWYLNYSDRTSCRITGMTRFACFWVENGKIKAPINVMRFDESMYNLFNEKYIGLTKEREFIMDPSSYGGRNTQSMRLPGLLVDKFTFTL